MMNKKKIIIIIGIILVILAAIGLLVLLIYNSNTSVFERKLEELKTELINNEKLAHSKNNYNVFISVSNAEEKAFVRNGSGKTLEEAIQNTSNKIKQVISKEDIKPVWIKIDVVNDESEIGKKDLDMLLKNSTYYVSNGIAFDDIFNVALIESELNNNGIINYNEGYLNLEKLNNYLSSKNKNISKKVDNYTKVIIFDCISYFYDETGIHRINSNENIYGRRAEENLDKDKISEIIINANKYLERNVKDDGSFVYEYSVNESEESSLYNILRHEGTIWSMIQSYNLQQDSNSKENLKEKIDLAIDYLLDKAVVYKDENTAYIKEIENNELKLGANGIAVIMLTEYMKTFENAEYKDIIVKLGNGILEMQKDNGSFYHVYEYPDFNEKEEFRTAVYDGEAAFALVRLYELTEDKTWLDAAEKSMDYFSENNYEQYADQWIEYSVNYIVDYLPKKEYFELGLKNVKDNYGTLLNNISQTATKLELLVTGFSIYNKAIENNIDVSFINLQGITNAIDSRINYQLNCYFYPEYVMYIDNPQKVLYTFFVRTADIEIVDSELQSQDLTADSDNVASLYTRSSDYRIRIDDVQHNINAFYMLYQVFDLFNMNN